MQDYLVWKKILKKVFESRSWDFDVTEQGWRYHMSNIMAAIGIVQLDRFQEIQETKKLSNPLYLLFER